MNKRANLQIGRGYKKAAPKFGKRFDGQPNIRHILFLYQIKSNVFTAQKACVKASCGCFMVISKAIRSTWSRFTPTEPNWTEKPAVINGGDIQHFSGKEPLNWLFFSHIFSANGVLIRL